MKWINLEGFKPLKPPTQRIYPYERPQLSMYDNIYVWPTMRELPWGISFAWLFIACKKPMLFVSWEVWMHVCMREKQCTFCRHLDQTPHSTLSSSSIMKARWDSESGKRPLMCLMTAMGVSGSSIVGQEPHILGWEGTRPTPLPGWLSLLLQQSHRFTRNSGIWEPVAKSCQSSMFRLRSMVGLQQMQRCKMCCKCNAISKGENHNTSPKKKYKKNILESFSHLCLTFSSWLMGRSFHTECSKKKQKNSDLQNYSVPGHKWKKLANSEQRRGLNHQTESRQKQVQKKSILMRSRLHT